MLIFDAHLNLGLNGVDWNRDLRMSVAEIRAAEKTLGMTEPGRGTNMVSFPELHRAGVGLGVATVLLDAIMLQPGWVRGVTRPVVTLERVVDNIDHVCQLAGDARHSAIGSDLDGGYGSEQTPADLDTIADLQRIPDLLGKRGYSDDDVRGVMHGNFLRFFAEVLPSGPPAVGDASQPAPHRDQRG